MSTSGTSSTHDAIHAVIHAVFRIESPRLIAGLARLCRDVGTAEELAQDALVAALEEWPRTGVPANPGAWLAATGKNRALNALRRRKMLARKHEQLGHELEAGAPPAERVAEALDEALDDDVGDDLLRLMFTAAHPVLPTEARVALTLRLLGGLTTDEIARAFLCPEATIAQRIVRAKRTLAERRIPFEVPRGDALGPRLASVLEVIYLIFNEGYAATAGDDLMRPALCEDALRLGRVLAQLAPTEPEVHGLVALMELNASRAAARVGPDGEPILLLDQDRSRWDQLLIRRGLAALARVAAVVTTASPSAAPSTIAGTGPAEARGSYVLQAEIVACHARARLATDTDWARIAALYGELAALAPSPVVELNRAVAIGMAEGPAAGLARVDALAAEPALAGYHLLPSARADLLHKLGRYAEAQQEFERAAGLARNARQRERLLDRARACVAAATGEPRR